MKNINLILSILFLFSAGMAAPSDGREEDHGSRVRAEGATTDVEKYEILKNATDHMIKLPDPEECTRLTESAMRPVRVREIAMLPGVQKTNFFDQISAKTISPADLSDAINTLVDDFEKHAKESSYGCYVRPFTTFVADNKTCLFLALYNASERIELQQ
ncbi:MAG: hypothetical protein ACK5PQ_02575 [Alphaproteobacteria bacterium]